jgi:hypothetical protein
MKELWAVLANDARLWSVPVAAAGFEAVFSV